MVKGKQHSADELGEQRVRMKLRSARYNSAMDAELRDLQRWLNRHLVSMVLIYWQLDEKGNSKGEPHIAAELLS